MSSGAVQRGGVPILPESVRVRAALDAGADLVVALPAPYACATAEQFAAAGVHLLAALGCDTLAFGAETPDAAALLDTARLLDGEELNARIRQNLAIGMTYAAARAAAADALHPGTGGLLRTPNNILGIEYCKAILHRHAALTPLALPRLGAAHGGGAGAHAGTPILGVCGGYQMLGQTLDDPTGSESGRPQTLRGLGLLPTRTVFSEQKRRAQVKATVAAAPFAGAELEGYEIHTGVTEAEGEPFAHYPDGGREGCVQGNVFGTYLHGLFDTGTLTEALAGWLCRRKGIDPSDAALIPMEEYRRQQFDILADGVRGALDMDAVYAAMGMEKH